MTAITSANLLMAVNRHIRARGVPPSRFGRQALNDPTFVSRLRSGSQPRPETVGRVRAFLAEVEA